MTISFHDEIAELESTLERERHELRELELEWERYDVELDDVRESVELLRTEPTRAPVDRVFVNPDTGRPNRGARREQLTRICHDLGSDEKAFRTVDVLNRVRGAEGEITPGIRTYTYSTMNILAQDGILTKVGRGKWRLA